MIAALVDRLNSSQAWLDGFGELVQGIVGGIYKVLVQVKLAQPLH